MRTGIFRSLTVSTVDHAKRIVEVKRNYLSAVGEYADRQVGSVEAGGQSVSSPHRTTRTDGRFHIHAERVVGRRYDIEDDNITSTVERTGELTILHGWDDRFDDAADGKQGVEGGKVSYFIPVKREGKVLAVLATGSTTQEEASRSSINFYMRSAARCR